MSRLVFLHNNLMVDYDKLNIPMVFVSFGFVEGKMYKRTIIKNNEVYRKRGNDRVYGGIFLIKHSSSYYIRVLDAYHICSLSRLYKNHPLDLYHRYKTLVTPIKFETLEEFATYKFIELDAIPCWTYYGNIEHQQISRQIKKRYRIMEGVDKTNFKELTNKILTNKTKEVLDE